MPHPYWPLFDLRVRTPRLVIRVPTDDVLADLVAASNRGIHDPATMPFTVPWTDVPAPRRQRESLQWWWRQRAEWTPGRWSLTGAVVVDGTAVGVQDLMATDFASLRSVATGSWLERAHQGRGLGTEMRAAILHLAFAGLGAVEAHTAAFVDNRASRATSRRLGYEENGEVPALRRGRPDRQVNLVLTRRRWEAQRRADITIEGLEPCLPMFGLAPESPGPPGR